MEDEQGEKGRCVGRKRRNRGRKEGRKDEQGEKGRCVRRKRRNRGGKRGGKRNKVRKEDV